MNILANLSEDINNGKAIIAVFLSGVAVVVWLTGMFLTKEAYAQDVEARAAIHKAQDEKFANMTKAINILDKRLQLDTKRDMIKRNKKIYENYQDDDLRVEIEQLEREALILEQAINGS